MAGTGPAAVLDAPALSPPANGLLNTATVVDHQDGEDARWMNGFTFVPEPCDDAITFDPCTTVSGDLVYITDAATTSGSATVTSATGKFNAADAGKSVTGAGIPDGTTVSSITNTTTIVLSQNATATATGVTLTIPARLPASNRRSVVTVQPWAVEAWDTCSAFGFEQSDYEGRARRALAARETKAVEKEFWTGTLISANRHLADNTNTTKLNASVGTPLRASLSYLCQAVNDNNLGRGMIHARAFLVELWFSLDMLYQNNGKLFTGTGVQVVPGAGYPGTAPDGTAASVTSEWAYATGPVVVHRSPVEVFARPLTQDTVSRTNNTVTVRAQRLYATQFNGCAVVGINVNPEQSS